MLKPEVLVDFLKNNHVTFYSGVPDSLLKDICAYVDDEFPKDNVQVIIGQKFFKGDEKKYYRFNYQDALNNCHAVVTHNSTACIDSCIRGVPTFCTSDLALAWPVANKDLTKIENPAYPDRDQWVYDLGYKQWTEKEVRDGTVFKRFKHKLGL